MSIHPAALREHEHQRRVFWCRAYAAAVTNPNIARPDLNADLALKEFDTRFPRPVGAPTEGTAS